MPVRPGGMRGLGGGDVGGDFNKETGNKRERKVKGSKRVERVLGFAQTLKGRALPLLLKLAGGAGFRSSAHPVGPNEPSYLQVNYTLPGCVSSVNP